MSLEATGNIKFDGKDYTYGCKSLNIEKISGDGDLDGMIDDLRRKMTAAIQEEFKVPVESITLAGYSMNLNFTIQGPTNRQLSEFLKEKQD